MINITENVCLQKFNTFNLAVNARYFTSVNSAHDIRAILANQQYHKVALFQLGGGSNVLFANDFPGLVIKNEIIGIETVKETEDHVWINVGAGESWHNLVIYCVNRGYGGIENLSLIPGTVGAAPIQNIGAYGAEFKSVFESLTAIKVSDYSEQHFFLKDCQFAYRNSIFKQTLKNKYIITSVTIRLTKQPLFNIQYGAIRHTLSQMGVNKPCLKTISDAVIQIRQHKLPDPKQIPNAGSFFKNPEISTERFTRLLKQFPNIPSFKGHTHAIKIPAAWMIDHCGWKGYRSGRVGVHEQHALVLVNHGQAVGSELINLAKDIGASVKQRFDIQLDPEVSIVG